MKSFFDLFPPPKILQMPAAGISISDDAVRFVNYHSKGGAVSLATWGAYPIEKGVVVGGVIQTPQKLLEILRKLSKENSVKFARVALPEEKSFVYKTKVIIPEEGEIRTAVEFTLIDNIPLSAEQTIFDFVILNFDQKTRTADVAVYVFPIDLSTSYAALIEQSGIMPVNFETESQAISRATVPFGKSGTHFLLHFANSKTIIVIVTNGVVQFASIVSNMGGGGDYAADSNEPVEFTTVKDELKKVFSYWQTEYASRGLSAENKIQSAIITGEIKNISKIPDLVTKYFRIPSKLGSVWQNVFSVDETIPGITFEESLSYAVTAGAAMLPTHD